MSTKMDNARNMEERIAELLNGWQTEGPSSSSGKADVLTDELVVECKHRGEFPNWFTEADEQVREYHKDHKEKTPVVVLHEKSKRHVYDHVLLRLIDLKHLLSGGEED